MCTSPTVSPQRGIGALYFREFRDIRPLIRLSIGMGILEDLFLRMCAPKFLEESGWGTQLRICDPKF